MTVDQLNLEQQKTASYCHSCGEVRPEGQLLECLVCRYLTCGMDGCSGRCACNDAGVELLHEIDDVLEDIHVRITNGAGNALPACSVEQYQSVLHDIDFALTSLQAVSA